MFKFIGWRIQKPLDGDKFSLHLHISSMHILINYKKSVLTLLKNLKWNVTLLFKITLVTLLHPIHYFLATVERTVPSFERVRKNWQEDSFFLHPYIFLSASPQCYEKTKLFILFFKIPKMHLNCIYFFYILDYGIWKNFGLTLLVKFWIHQFVF